LSEKVPFECEGLVALDDLAAAVIEEAEARVDGSDEVGNAIVEDNAKRWKRELVSDNAATR